MTSCKVDNLCAYISRSAVASAQSDLLRQRARFYPIRSLLKSARENWSWAIKKSSLADIRRGRGSSSRRRLARGGFGAATRLAFWVAACRISVKLEKIFTAARDGVEEKDTEENRLYVWIDRGPLFVAKVDNFIKLQIEKSKRWGSQFYKINGQMFLIIVRFSSLFLYFLIIPSCIFNI